MASVDDVCKDTCSREERFRSLKSYQVAVSRAELEPQGKLNIRFGGEYNTATNY